MATLEQTFWGQHVFPFFGVMILALQDDSGGDDEDGAAERLHALMQALRSIMPRASDIFVEQPAHRRIVLALVGTGRDGSEVVRRKLLAAVQDGQLGATVRVLGPAIFPDDGVTARELVGHALEPDSAGGDSR